MPRTGRHSRPGKIGAEFARLGTAFDQAGPGLSLADLDGTVVLVNDRLSRLGNVRAMTAAPFSIPPA